jgi:hypothetical protein
VPNAPEETVITAALEGLAIGQCAAHFTRNYSTTVKELFEIMRQYARSGWRPKEAKGNTQLVEAGRQDP